MVFIYSDVAKAAVTGGSHLGGWKGDLGGT